MLLALSLLLVTPPLAAHPMGNFSISHYAGIRIEHGYLDLLYVIDMAEIPTFQEIQQAQIAPREGDPKLNTYLWAKAEALKSGLLLELDGRPLPLETVSRKAIFPPGAGGLPTMKIGLVYRARFQPVDRPQTLYYHDRNFPERAGWKEVVVTAGEPVRLANSSVPEKDRSQQLANYPTDLLNSPPQVLEARVDFVLKADPAGSSAASKSQKLQMANRDPGADKTNPSALRVRQNNDHAAQSEAVRRSSPDAASARHATGEIPGSLGPASDSHLADLQSAAPRPESATAGRLALVANKQATPRNGFTELMAQRQFGFWFLLTAALIAAGLGALHALEPGHGKTIVAAYLVGSRGTAWHACLLGIIVTASHTAGVYVLGAATLYASHYIVPERIYPWLGALSGSIIAGVGAYLFLRRYAGDSHSHGHGHSHELGEAHSHWPGHYHEHRDEHHGGEEHHHRHAREYPQEYASSAVHDHGHTHAEEEIYELAHAHSHWTKGGHIHHHGLAQGQAHTHMSQWMHAQAGDLTKAADCCALDSQTRDVQGSDSSRPSYRALLALGVTGGMVPCPAALVVLLSAVAMHRIGFGLFLIVAFSIGLAAVLIAVGLLMVFAGRFMSRLKGEGPLVTRWLPLASAAGITILGLIIAVRALVTGGILVVHL